MLHDLVQQVGAEDDIAGDPRGFTRGHLFLERVVYAGIDFVDGFGFEFQRFAVGSLALPAFGMDIPDQGPDFLFVHHTSSFRCYQWSTLPGGGSVASTRWRPT